MNQELSKLWSAEIVSRLLTAFIAVYTARIIGVETYGLVGYVAAVVSCLSVLVRFGTDSILVRELSRAHSGTEEEKAAFRTTTIIVRSAIGVLCTAALIVLGIHADTPLLTRLYYANALGLFGLFLPLDYFLQAEKRFGAMAMFRIVFNIVNCLIIVLTLRDATAAWWIPLSGGLSLLVTQAMFVHRLHGTFGLPGVKQFKRLSMFLVKESAPVFGSMFLLLLIGQFGIILLRHAASAEELGWYVTAYKVCDIGNAMLVPVAVTIFPRLSDIWMSGNKRFRTRTLLDGMRITVPLAMLAAGTAMVCGKEAVGIVFGERFQGSSPFMTILLGTLVFRAISMFFANALIAGGRQSQHLLVTAAVVSVNIGLSLYMIPAYGAYGAAWVNFAVFVIELIGYYVIVRGSIEPRIIAQPLLTLTGVWIGAYAAACCLSAVLSPMRHAALVAGGTFAVLFGTLVVLTLPPSRQESVG